MAKKNRNGKKTETPEIVLPAQGPDLTAPAQVAVQTATNPAEDPPGTGNSPEAASSDELLDDVRRSLIIEEVDQSQKESKWWRRFRRKDGGVEPDKPPDEIDLPVPIAPIELEEEPAAKEESRESGDEIDNLIDLLVAESRAETVEPVVATEVEPPLTPEPTLDIEKLKEQAFSPRVSGTETISEVRTIALEGGEEVFVEVQAPTADPLDERFSAFENALKPYQQYISIALAVFAVGVIVIVGLMMLNIYQRTALQAGEEAATVPYPASVALPGGWSFKLSKGALEDGKWEPRGAEWLQGTEVCRWVALPWSPQLEAVIRTLNPQDAITLTMSNNDRLIYKVYSIRQLKPAQLEQLDANSPGLLLILTGSDVEKRWVLTALP